MCNFTIAVNRRNKREGQPDADFFRVTTWNALAESCGKWLIKGRKVAVVGSVSIYTYQTKDGRHGANMEVLAQDVEFLSSGVQGEQKTEAAPPKVDKQSGMEQVEPEEELPFE